MSCLAWNADCQLSGPYRCYGEGAAHISVLLGPPRWNKSANAVRHRFYGPANGCLFETDIQDEVLIVRCSIPSFSEGLEGFKEVNMSELLQALRAFDGKATSILSEARTRFGGSAGFLDELAALIASQDGSVADGATWLIKDCAESGVVPGPPETAAIVARLDAVPTWQAALHLCQTAEFFAFSPDQARRFAQWAAQFLDHERPFLRAWSMNALQHAARQAPDLAPLAETALSLAENDKSASVRARARKIRATTPDRRT